MSISCSLRCLNGVHVLHSILLYRSSGEWKFGGGGGGVSDSTEFCIFQLLSQSSSPSLQFYVVAHYFLSSTNFILPLELLIGFFLVNLVGHVKMISGSLKW